MDQAATPTGGAEVSARPDASAAQPTEQRSVHDRLKAALFSQPEPKEETSGIAPDLGESTEPTQQASQEDETAEPAEAAADEPSESTEDVQLSSVKDLAEATGLDLDRILGLDIPTKIDGKEGKATLRDLLKSYQLEGHLNQKLMTHAEERKAFEAETARKVQEYQHRVKQLDAAVTLAQKILDGEYADVNWQELQRTDPLKFQAQYGAYKMRLDGIQQLASHIGQERQQHEAQQQAAFIAYRAEQQKLLDSKIPEWADKAKRDKDVADMVTTLGEAYGLTEQELRSVVDHRQLMIARDAMRWQQLQKAKPTVVNKVKAAPKLLKPGTTQSKAAQANLQTQSLRARLKETGRPRDAAALIKQRLLANR